MSYEILRRRALQYAREVKYSLVQLDNVGVKIKTIENYSLIKPLEEVQVSLERLKSQLQDISLHLHVDIDGIGRVDGVLESRMNYLEYLSNELQSELFQLQVGCTLNNIVSYYFELYNNITVTLGCFTYGDYIRTTKLYLPLINGV